MGGKAPTAAEKKRMAKLAETGCRACEIRGRYTGMATEVHHQVDCGRRVGHHATVALCSFHHRGVLPPGYSESEALEHFGPAVSHGSKLFRADFGSDEAMLALQNRWLKK